MKYRLVLTEDATKAELKNVEFETEDYGELIRYCDSKIPTSAGWQAYGLLNTPNGETFLIYKIFDNDNNTLGYILNDVLSDDE